MFIPDRLRPRSEAQSDVPQRLVWAVLRLSPTRRGACRTVGSGDRYALESRRQGKSSRSCSIRAALSFWKSGDASSDWLGPLR